MIEMMLQAERALMVGMVEQAERLYWVAVKNDPRNAIAVVGLARVALERNDDRAAYELSRQALTIDPENAAALRLEARLSEVLTHRGEAVERPSFVQPGGPGTGAVDRLAPGSRNAGRVGLPEPPDAPFPPMRRAGTDGAGESIGTVMGRQRAGWQPAKMPVSAPSSVPAGMPAPSDARPVQINVEAVADAQPIDAQRVEPQPIRIWPRPETSPIPSSGPTRYAATVEAEEPGSSGQAPSMPGGVPQGAVGER
ncbi:MAG: hypothetical protein H0W07_08945, partial [Chloroflexi bacterium]|nr:hypothetical protein [Chloroflexota bacterium]